MKKVMLLLLVVCFFVPRVNSSDVFDEEFDMSFKKGKCSLGGYGLELTCEKNWTARDYFGDTVLIKIPERPSLTVSVSQADTEISFLEEMDKEFFQKKNLYLENFQRVYDEVAGMRALKIKAFSKNAPNVRYLGYFYIDNGILTSILFSVYPQEKWDEDKFIIRDIKNSFLLSKN